MKSNKKRQLGNIQRFNEEIRTLLAQLSELQKFNQFYKNILISELKDILIIEEAKKIKFLSKFSQILEILIGNSIIFEGLDSRKIHNLVDIGTDGCTNCFCLLGLDIDGINGDKGLRHRIEEYNNCLEQIKLCNKSIKIGNFEYIPKYYPLEGDLKHYDISYMELTLHHLKGYNKNQNKSRDEILRQIWNHTNKRLIIKESIIIKNDNDTFNYKDRDGGKYLFINDFLNLESLRNSLKEIKYFSEFHHQWLNFQSKIQEIEEIPFTHLQTYLLCLDKNS